MNSEFASPCDGGVRIALLVQPRASRVRFGPVHGHRLKIAITSAPVDGAANQAVIELVAKSLGVPKRNVSITTGQASRRKTVQVLGVEAATVVSSIS